MQTTSISDPGHVSLLQRLRRMGLVLIGNQKTADAILRDAFNMAAEAFGPPDGASESDIFRLGFDAFDNAVHRRGKLVLLGRPMEKDGNLASGVHNLTYVERLSISLLLVEEMTPREAAVMSGRPPQVLEKALVDAINKLDAEGF